MADTAAGPGADTVLYDKVALIGLGLEGGSMSHAMRRGGLAGRIVGTARSAETRAIAAEINLVDEVTETAAAAVQGADLVVLAVPVGAMGAVAAEIAPHLKPGATVTDVGSVKRAVIETVGPHIPAGVHFVPAHPIAGTEHSGPRSGFAELFDNRWLLIVPPPGTDRAAVDRLRGLWEGMGSHVDEMEPDHHDLVLAVTSHAPHLIAYTMVGVADHLSRVTDSEVIKYSAAGFRDFTRIAASDPTMWRDVFLTNKDATLDVLGRFTEELFMLQRAIRMGDGEMLHAYFTETRAIRRGIIEAGQDTAAPDFGRGGKAMRMCPLMALVVAGWAAGAAVAQAPERSIRAMPRPAVQEPVAADAAVAAAVTSALAVLVSPRPLPKPLAVAVSAAPANTIIGAPRPVVPRVSAANRAPVDPIKAFFQGLAAPKPVAAAAAAAAPSGLAVPQSPRPESRPNGFAKLVSAITTPRATSRKGSVCGVPEIKGSAIRAIGGAGACGIANPVRITSVSGVAVAGGPTIDCTTAKALNDWVRSGVMPAVGRTGGGLAQVNVIASYACRSRNNVRGAKLSEHALGHAVDVSGVTLKDGTTLTVLDHWRSGKYGKIIKAMHGSACGTFGTVLGPNADRYHQNHLHLDTARYRSGSYCR